MNEETKKGGREKKKHTLMVAGKQSSSLFRLTNNSWFIFIYRPRDQLRPKSVKKFQTKKKKNTHKLSQVNKAVVYLD